MPGGIMIEYPYFKCYPKDIISSVDWDMADPDERGAYMALLLHSWIQTPQATLPDDPAILRHITGLTPTKFARFWEKFAKKFPKSDDRLANPRMKMELQELQEGQQKRSDHARKAADARWGKDARAMPEQCPSNPQAMPENAILDPESESDPKKSKSRAKKAVPDGAFEIADALIGLVESNLDMSINGHSRRQWAEHVDKLWRLDKVSFDRQRKAMQALGDNWGVLYWPEVRSGKAWRDKFGAVEAAMKRAEDGDGESTAIPTGEW